MLWIIGLLVLLFIVSSWSRPTPKSNNKDSGIDIHKYRREYEEQLNPLNKNQDE